MTAFTWSSSRTISPMTTVCLPAGLNAAHDVSPMGGVSLTPAATTVRSLRGTDTLNTPSVSLNTPLAPVSSSIFPVSNDTCGGPASAVDAEASARTAMNVRMLSSGIGLRECLLPGRDREVVEVDDTHGLGPQTELARLRERLVVGVDDLVAIEEYLEAVPVRLDRQVVPDATLHCAVPTGELDALAFHDVIEPDVVLERVGAGDVVVVRVLEAEDESTALVDLAGNRLAFHREAEVLHLGSRERDGESVVGLVRVGLSEDIRRARRVLISLDDPLALAAAPRPPKLEPFG